MRYTLRRISGPAAEPVSLAEAKSHCKVDVTDDDAYITALVPVAREETEKLLRRVIGQQTWEMKLECFPAGERIKIPFPPLIAVLSVKYIDVDGIEHVLFDSEASPAIASSIYVVETADEPGFIYLVPDEEWPDDEFYTGFPVTVKFDCGLTTVPAPVKHAILLMIGHLYANREAVIVAANYQQASAVEIPLGVEALLDQYRFYGIIE